MSITEMKLESNSKIRIDFGGGNLSSDGGLLLMKEFLSKIGFERLAATKFKTTDRAKRVHTDGRKAEASVLFLLFRRRFHRVTFFLILHYIEGLKP